MAWIWCCCGEGWRPGNFHKPRVWPSKEGKKKKKPKKTGPGKMPKIDYSSKNIKLQTNRERVGLFLF